MKVRSKTILVAPGLPEAFVIENDSVGGIESTTFFDSLLSLRGFFFLSCDGGFMRLLVPDSHLREVSEMCSAREVVVTRGFYRANIPRFANHEGVGILFEDDTDSPFCLHVLSDAVDLLPDKRDRDRPGQSYKWSFSLYTRDGVVLQLPARLRCVKSLPCLRSWGK